MNFIRPIGSAPNVGMEGNSGHLVLSGITYSINAQNVNLLRGWKLATAALTVTVAAQTVTLSRIGGKNIIASPLAVTVGGQALTMSKGWRIATAAAVYAVGQQDIGVLRGRVLAQTAATYTVAGQAITLRQGKFFTLLSPLYQINAQPLAFSTVRRLTASALTVTVNGQAVTLARYSKRIILDVNTVRVGFGEMALYKLPARTTDVTLLYNKGRGKRRFWNAVRAKEMIDPDW